MPEVDTNLVQFSPSLSKEKARQNDRIEKLAEKWSVHISDSFSAILTEELYGEDHPEMGLVVNQEFRTAVKDSMQMAADEIATTYYTGVVQEVLRASDGMKEQLRRQALESLSELRREPEKAQEKIAAMVDLLEADSTTELKDNLAEVVEESLSLVIIRVGKALKATRTGEIWEDVLEKVGQSHRKASRVSQQRVIGGLILQTLNNWRQDEAVTEDMIDEMLAGSESGGSCEPDLDHEASLYTARDVELGDGLRAVLDVCQQLVKLRSGSPIPRN